MGENEFEERLGQAKTAQARIERLVKEVFQDGVHYGPVSDREGAKPTLLAAGSEETLRFFDIVPMTHIEQVTGDGVDTPHIAIVARVEGYDQDGDVVCVGYAGANSFETRFLKSVHTCPDCGVDNVRYSKDKDEYYCWRKTKGCGATFDAKRFDGAVPKPDQLTPWNMQNALIKIAEKRAKVDLALGLGLRAYFTQDMEKEMHTPAEIRPAGYALPDNGGSIPVAVSPKASTDPVASYMPPKEEPLALSGDPWNDVCTVAKAIAVKTGEDASKLIQECSSFPGNAGFGAPNRQRHSEKWMQSTLKKLLTRHKQAGLVAMVGSDIPF